MNPAPTITPSPLKRPSAQPIAPSALDNRPTAALAPHPLLRPPRHSCLPQTTDLSPLKGRRVLTVLDEDNLRISMRQYNLPLSYRRLLGRLHDETQLVFPLAVITAAEGDHRRGTSLANSGWSVIVVPRETVFTSAGPQLKANADFDLAFELGHLVNPRQFDTVLLGTGDGDLAVAIGRGIRRNCPHLHLFTLSVPGSASARLRTRADLFDGNILVGRDLIHTARHQN
jgi:hypothetical protein